ncbi:hypothetical protein KBD08_02450 [Candidatus Babeliales bacterium]|nr:hypothetical protein [Candidatus Babeliales bacterium]
MTKNIVIISICFITNLLTASNHQNEVYVFQTSDIVKKDASHEEIIPFLKKHFKVSTVPVLIGTPSTGLRFCTKSITEDTIPALHLVTLGAIHTKYPGTKNTVRQDLEISNKFIQKYPWINHIVRCVRYAWPHEPHNTEIKVIFVSHKSPQEIDEYFKDTINPLVLNELVDKYTK